MDADLILAGGGLASVLVAYRLAQVHPALRTLVVEKSARLGGNHTWSFHGHDLSVPELEWLSPFIESSWSQYDVRFPAFSRAIDVPYHSIASPRLHEVATAALGDRVRLGTAITALDETSVTLADGGRLTAGCVLDGRGLPADIARRRVAWQLFHGLELELDAPHGLSRPTLLDACVAQPEEFRFFYVLPRGERVLLVEDTRYANAPNMPPDMGRGVEAYAREHGWWPARVIRRELGAMPVPFEELPRVPLGIGLRGGFFHPTTGYSTPFAVHVAEVLAGLGRFEPAIVATQLDETRRALLPDQRYFHYVNRVFIAADPPAQARVFQRFYDGPDESILAFHAARLTTAEKLRLLATKPPVSIPRAAVELFR